MKSTLALVVVFSFMLLASCHRDGTTPIPGPVITAFTPSGGKAGDTVTITGSSFSAQLSGNTVMFSDTAATIITAAASKLTVIVPHGAATGKISVTVNGKTAASADNFVVSAAPPPPIPPAITGFTPGAGPAGTPVTITGTGFAATAAANTVKFNGVAASVTNATATQLVATVPATAATGKITVTVGGLTATSATDFTVNVAPVISSFSPVLGLPGDTVIITGTGFSTVAGNNTVKFSNNVTAMITAATATQLTVTVPAGAVTGTISATVNALTAASATGFEVLQDIPRSGLVAFYPFSSNANDASGHAFNLTLEGTYSAAADRFGSSGKAWYFNGGNSYAILLDASQAQAPQPLTVQVWVKYDSLLSSTIMGKYSYPPAAGYLLGISPDGSGAGLITLDMDGFNATSVAGVLPANTGGQWVLIGITYDGSTLQFFRNGSPVTTIVHTGTVTATSSGDLRIGLSGDGGTGLSAFKCAIDDVTIYNRVLSNTEILQLYNQTVSKK